MKKKEKLPVGPAVIDVYETEIEYDCPVRGKVKQKVRVKRYETMEPSPMPEEAPPSKSLTEKLERQFPGLLIMDDSLDEQDEEEVE